MRHDSNPDYRLRIALAVLGAFIIFLGLNVAFGGIATLGWQGGQDAFVSVTAPDLFAIRDNHVRFIGGVWLGLGLLVLSGALAFRRLRPVLIAAMGLIFVGGLARFSAGDLSLLTSADILPSLLFELVAAPLLGLWFSKAERLATS
jgi:hypothetical protein